MLHTLDTSKATGPDEWNISLWRIGTQVWFRGGMHTPNQGENY